VAGLLLTAHYSGPRATFVHSYAGNITASFAVYFILATPCRDQKFPRALPAVLGLATVQLFEATDGFGVMSNTYDPADYLANGVGVLLALLLDTVTSQVASRWPTRSA
jgi:hypothetical protein